MGHWYKQDGSPLWQVPYADAARGMRAATLRDARKVGAYPSVTAIISREPAPGLDNWKIEQGIMAALTNPDIQPDMPISQIMRIIKRDAKAEAREAAKVGTDIHDAIESAFRGKLHSSWHYETVCAVLDLVKDRCGGQDWKPETWFAHPMGFGGKIDLISDEWILDFKSKEGLAEQHKMYNNHLMQLVAYKQGTTDVPKKLANVIVSRTHPGSVAWWPWDNQNEIEREWKIFQTLLEGWQHRTGYYP